MDGNTMTMSDIRQSFRPPLRILVPKLLKSRDSWKAKSDRRKAKLKAASIKIRDCSPSRDRWRERAELLPQHTRQPLEQIQYADRGRLHLQAQPSRQNGASR